LKIEPTQIPALACVLALFFIPAARVQAADPHSWPGVFNPFEVVTLNFELDPVRVWESIKRDTNFYDPVLNIRVPVLMWADGEQPITVQLRRKSDPALPSEENPEKVSLKIDINEYVAGQEWRGLKKLSLENGNGGNGVLREGASMHLHRLAAEHGFYDWSAGYCSWVRVIVNEQYVGLYASPEQRDKQFLRNRGLYKPGSVWLYEVNGGTALDQTVATTHSPTYNFLNFSPFLGSTNPPANLEAALEPWIDMRGMLTMAAIEAFAGNSDGLFTKAGKNSFAVDYLPTAQYRRWYLPWDLDNGMTS
jgi:spore coat protein CotH